eukprot:15645438-Heterocapsa_arctica.AAC.1
MSKCIPIGSLPSKTLQEAVHPAGNGAAPSLGRGIKSNGKVAHDRRAAGRFIYCYLYPPPFPGTSCLLAVLRACLLSWPPGRG